MPDMKTLTMRELNRSTATVLDAVERGQVFELRRNGKVVGYITQKRPVSLRQPDWKAHFDWLRSQTTKNDRQVLDGFERERGRQRSRDRALGK